MKRILAIIAITTFIALPSFSQEEENLQKLENLENNTVTVDDKDTAVLEIGDKVFSIKETGDETRIKLGKKEYRVVEDSDGVTVWKSSKEDRDKEFYHSHRNRFRGHLGGIEFGFNGYLTDSWGTSLDPGDYYLDLNTAKSNNWNFILPCLSIGMTRHLGFVTALGLNFNNYRFDGDNSITKDANGVVGPSYPDSVITYSRSKLATTYATLPILLEAQIPVENGNTINIGAGVIGAIKLGSHTKVVYYTDGKQKEKSHDDFSLNVLRYGATARIGYEFFQIYATRYFTPLFEKGKGPELYPFEVGIAFTIND